MLKLNRTASPGQHKVVSGIQHNVNYANKQDNKIRTGVGFVEPKWAQTSEFAYTKTVRLIKGRQQCAFYTAVAVSAEDTQATGEEEAPHIAFPSVSVHCSR